MLHWNGNDPFIEAIAKRARSVLARQAGGCEERVVDTLPLPARKLRSFLAAEDSLIDAVFLIDVVAALVHECGVDPKWLLTGQYDATLHREALLLGEDRGPKGARAVRELVATEYRQLRRPSFLSSVPSRLSTFFKS